MKTRKRKKKKKSSRRKTREFSGNSRVSRNPRETTATARPLSAQHLQNTCKGRKEREFRERERFRTNVGECPVSPTSPQTTLKPTPNDLLLP